MFGNPVDPTSAEGVWLGSKPVTNFQMSGVSFDVSPDVGITMREANTFDSLRIVCMALLGTSLLKRKMLLHALHNMMLRRGLFKITSHFAQVAEREERYRAAYPLSLQH